MILSREDVEPLGLKNAILPLNGVIYSHLVSALTYLTLAIEHETSTERVDLIIIRARAVGLPTLDWLWGLVVYVFPFRVDFLDQVGFKTAYSELGHFFIGIVVEASHEVCSVVDCSQTGAFSWSGAPSVIGHLNNWNVEALSFLHPLDVGLESSGQPLDQFVSRNVVRWLCNKQLWSVIFFICSWVDNFYVLGHPMLCQFSLIYFLDGSHEIFFWIWRSLSVESRKGAFVVHVFIYCFYTSFHWR